MRKSIASVVWPECGNAATFTPPSMRRAFYIKPIILMVLAGLVAARLSAQPVMRNDAPPAPVAPASVSRDAQGQATVRAIRLDEPLRVDGRLDEAVYAQNESVSGFIQQVPREGAAATERTEAWVMFDGENLYVAARCWDTAPP